MSRTRRALVTGIAALALLGGSLTGCSSNASDPEPAGDGAAADTIRIGVVGASDPYWPIFEEAAEAEGIDVEIIDFSDYNLPNPALSDGDIEINQFQHIIYLAQHNEATGDNLQPIGSTAIYPLGLYSTQYESVEDIPEGATVAIPNDVTNRARALLVLQSAGLLTLEGGGSIVATPDDIDAERSRVVVTELDAALTATSLSDVAAAIINNDFVEKAGLSFAEALAQDDPEDPNAFPYVNIFAARDADKNNETYLKLVEIYHSTQEVLDSAFEVSGGTAQFVNVSSSELQASLAEVQKNVADLG